MKKILFLDDRNGYEAYDPLAFLVEIPDEINSSILHILERSQSGVGSRGGNWREIMQDGKIEYNLISKGRKSDFSESGYDEEYKLISGTY